MKPLDNTQAIEQAKLKTLKLLEEFARCLATEEMRQMTSIDLNDCCKFWSSLLNSKLVSEMLCDEQRYLLSSTACDCLASIGASVFELLPFQKRVYCLTNLLHLTRSQSTLIRASSSRALGVYVTFSSLKEDQNFLSDLSLCLINLLATDSNNLVRQKAAWSMSNLSEVLIENALKMGRLFIDEFNLTTWLRLLDQAAVSCFKEADKIRSYLVRTLGNLINYISLVAPDQLASSGVSERQAEVSITQAIEALCSCRAAKMLKVRWNLSYAIGVAVRNFNTWQVSGSSSGSAMTAKHRWLETFYDTLFELFTQSSNFKVRINACQALMTINLNENNALVRSSSSSSSGIGSRPVSSGDTIYLRQWLGLVEAFSKLRYENIDANNEQQHKNNLLHQVRFI
jgi:hypothetical protein